MLGDDIYYCFVYEVCDGKTAMVRRETLRSTIKKCDPLVRPRPFKLVGGRHDRRVQNSWNDSDRDAQPQASRWTTYPNVQYRRAYRSYESYHIKELEMKPLGTWLPGHV